jgi:hypothetical protein
MYIKKILIIIIILISSNLTFAQFEDFEEENYSENEETSIKDQIFYGGDFGFQFGTVTFLNISPQIGYYITDYWSAGVGATYMFYKNNFFDLKTSVYGGSLFTEIYPLSFIVLHGESQMLNIEIYENPNNPFRAWDLSLLGGGGYRMRIGEKGIVNYLILWNFNQSKNSVYSNPVFRISFYF